MRRCLICNAIIPDDAHKGRKYCSLPCQYKASKFKVKDRYGHTPSYLHYHNNLEKGLCPYCGNIPENGRKICVKCLSYENKRHRTKHRELKEEVIGNYGGKCSCCGETQTEFLSIEHINGGGKKHRNSLKQGFYYWLKSQRYPKDNFELLCYNCNMAKGFYGYCPHKGHPILEANTKH